jgi:hypothetical protein
MSLHTSASLPAVAAHHYSNDSYLVLFLGVSPQDPYGRIEAATLTMTSLEAVIDSPMHVGPLDTSSMTVEQVR